jgi:hypothetical protein
MLLAGQRRVISRCRINKKKFPGDYGNENKDYARKKGMGIYF